MWALAGSSVVVCAQKEKDAKGKAAESANFVKGNVAQILGIRGGDKESNIWKIRLQLTKPVTWIPLIWGIAYSACHTDMLLQCMQTQILCELSIFYSVQQHAYIQHVA